MQEQYISECKVIQQNCTYTAEAHHQMAISQKRIALFLEIVPAVCAAVTGALVATGIAENGLLVVTVASSFVSAAASILSPSKAYQEHLAVAKEFSALKHDARFLHEAKVLQMKSEEFALATDHLHQKYNDLLKSAPPTSEGAFRRAQKVVQIGTHEPDRDPSGKVK
jgi:hypothetical protein